MNESLTDCFLIKENILDLMAKVVYGEKNSVNGNSHSIFDNESAIQATFTHKTLIEFEGTKNMVMQ